MRVAFYGADGRTGTYVIDGALEVGHEVVAFTRSTDMLTQNNNHLRIIEGTLIESDAIDLAIK
jgi:putative NADH-flavin reductase